MVRVCVPVTPRGSGRPRFGRTKHLARADVGGDAIRAWQEVEFGWGELHDTGAEGGPGPMPGRPASCATKTLTWS